MKKKIIGALINEIFTVPAWFAAGIFYNMIKSGAGSICFIFICSA